MGTATPALGDSSLAGQAVNTVEIAGPGSYSGFMRTLCAVSGGGYGHGTSRTSGLRTAPQPADLRGVPLDGRALAYRQGYGSQLAAGSAAGAASLRPYRRAPAKR